MENRTISYVNWGLAGVFNGEICLHKDLQLEKWKNLHDWILTHELNHDKPKGYTKKDFMLDLQDTFVKPKDISRDYMLFYLSTPTSWTQSLPVNIYKGKIWFDLQKLFTWFISLCLIFGFFYWWTT